LKVAPEILLAIHIGYVYWLFASRSVTCYSCWSWRLLTVYVVL